MTWNTFCTPTQFWLGWATIATFLILGLLQIYKSKKNEREHSAHYKNLNEAFEKITARALEDLRMRIDETNKVRTEYLALIMEERSEQLPDPNAVPDPTVVITNHLPD